MKYFRYKRCNKNTVNSSAADDFIRGRHGGGMRVALFQSVPRQAACRGREKPRFADWHDQGRQPVAAAKFLLTLKPLYSLR